MPLIKEPFIASCFQCKKQFQIKYVQSTHNYSQKNDWDYWTEEEKNKGLKICDNCLVKLYRNHKLEFRALINNEKKQRILRQYIASGTICGKTEATFIIDNVKNNKSNKKTK